MSDSPPSSATSFRRWVWPVVKWGLCIVVLVLVGMRAAGLWNRDEIQNVDVSPGWLLAAMAAYLVGWIPSAWYWQRLMKTLGHEAGLFDSARAYYCGHLGKYVPGKAGVLLIRAGLMRSRGISAAVAAVTATFETLLMMGAGVAVGLALFPVLNWPPIVTEYIDRPVLVPVIVAGLTVLALPVIAMILRRFAYIMTPHDLSGEKRTAGVDVKLVAVGLGVFCISWALLGLSLGLTVRSVVPESDTLAMWPVWMGAVAIATAIGFIAIFAPGGIGVREGLLIEVLRVQPEITEKQAVVVAVLLRLVWIVAEITAAVALYYLVRASKPESPVGDEAA